MPKAAVLALSSGEIFQGISIGANRSCVGDVIFNTAITGYQEILTDPSYAQQIITLTHPHIGNTGVNTVDLESNKVYASGLVIRDLPKVSHSWRKKKSLNLFLREQNVAAIAGIDTRALTLLLRKKGSVASSISTEGAEKALCLARGFKGLSGIDLAQQVSTKETYHFDEGTHQFGATRIQKLPQKSYKVVAYDFGIKKNIMKILVDHGCDLVVVNAKTPAQEVLSFKPDGVFLSNGPGDPEPCGYAIDNIQYLLEKNIPMFGICLGHQLLALALGANTEQMSFGHHGANHPVQDLENKTILITSQNHSFVVSEKHLPKRLFITHRSLFDGTIQGFRVVDKPAFGFQGHPEASPGPQESAYFFEHFIQIMSDAKNTLY